MKLFVVLYQLGSTIKRVTVAARTNSDAYALARSRFGGIILNVIDAP